MKNKNLTNAYQIPGPNSEKLLKRRNDNVPRGPFNTAQTFAEKAKGAKITDVDGQEFIDFAGAIGSLNAGHCPPKVVEALKAQIENYLHPCFHVMMYEPYIELAEKLNHYTPGNHHKKTFFLNSGAEAVENAVKIARKYTGRKAILSFERGFHGRTYMAMSLTSKVKPYKYQFGPFVADTYKMSYPYYYRKPDGMTDDEIDQECIQRLNTFFLSEVSAEETAAVIMEPVQGEGGFIVPSKNFVKQVKEICTEHGILFISDEVQAGFGRTGKLFASEHFDLIPDLMTMSKSIAAGLPISAVTGRAEIMDAPGVGEIGGTYGGSPLGCVAANEVMNMMIEEDLPARANHIGELVRKRFLSFQEKYEEVGDVRGLGAMMAMELVEDRQSKEPAKELTQKVIRESIQNGLIIMGSGLYGNVIRILSPLVISDEDLIRGLDILESVMKNQCTLRR
ncbi:4-aminobutyrate--2-oxoglutarate transaminase [Salipaludibacillus keqinensis]|uniref:(S)-3-amino-2-methylpropionate transaminase n=1 Tax=Salipaludibacillus keqinensis TaxID=2045207 RepID=A0A323TYG9_9BACI|nr:4-aminobutyrate--2-oxoglutarate transaminase [Salipaludibacillus keqinensis]PYZ94595.1 4-aminobutyrate--2-oxoglutarate transaminase [Salipaludibacillus keqinensis]